MNPLSLKDLVMGSLLLAAHAWCLLTVCSMLAGCLQFA
jgi:lipoprotein